MVIANSVSTSTPNYVIADISLSDFGRKEIKIAANHLNNILSTIDNKETLNDIKLTINAASSISTKIDDMSDDFKKLTQDKELTKSIRDLTIGLSKFLNEIYP